MKALWNDNNGAPQFEALSKSINTDVLVIGGGMAGLLCAYMLKKRGADCVLIEATRICAGVTAGTTAKLTYHHGMIFDKLIKEQGRKRAGLYLQAQREAFEEMLSLCSETDCDCERADSYVYTQNAPEKLRRELIALKTLGIMADICETDGLPITTAGAVRVRNQAHIHPLKLLYSLARELRIYEHTKALQIMPGRVITERGEVRCNKIIVATHFPIINKHGAYFLKMYQHRSYVIALRGAEKHVGMYVDESEKGMSFRECGDLLLVGGGSHRTGKNGGSYTELEAFAKKYYPTAHIAYKWAAQDCMTLDGIPYIGQYSRCTPGLYVATGFNKWGVTSSMVSATILADLCEGRENRYAEVFSPSRSILRPQLFVNAFESVAGLVTPTAPRCPHMGCALKYNTEEHSWDCPCHGSRFTKEGELINNPATDDKRM